MKLQADIEIINLSQASSGIGNKGKPTKSVLVIGKGVGCSKEKTYLLLATKKNASGTKFKVYNNINSVFDKFIHEGKCTIRLNEPSIDIRICQAESIQLKAFVKILRLGNINTLPSTVSLQPITSAVIANKEFISEPIKLVITSRLNYPLTDVFPHSLTELSINGIKLSVIESRIFKIKGLRLLNLSNNSISELPDGWDNLSLSSINLSNNCICHLSSPFLSSSSLRTSLSKLDLSSNTMTHFPAELWRFKSLESLKLSSNKIQQLPSGFAELSRKRLNRRLKLYLDSNNISFLPSDILNCLFDTFDISNNPLSTSKFLPLQNSMDDLKVMSLMELAARSIKAFSIPYTIYDVSILKAYLDAGSRCCNCKKFIFESKDLQYVELAANSISETYSGPPVCTFEQLVCNYCKINKLNKH